LILFSCSTSTFNPFIFRVISLADLAKAPSTFSEMFKIIFEAGKKHGIYLRTLGNIVMLVPPLAISHRELNLLIQRTIKTIKTLNF